MHIYNLHKYNSFKDSIISEIQDVMKVNLVFRIQVTTDPLSYLTQVKDYRGYITKIYRNGTDIVFTIGNDQVKLIDIDDLESLCKILDLLRELSSQPK